ncbi:prolipoprotein diacylglyceryl transferase [Advenella alkanexedens]|uniref:Phosphatidylglycerol--prolipoprotein diacylglyceryl transferase n=1 Tax=Advenella alkanexedens TaxID=1481665 RepID=A0ABS6NRN0_9BURK|nr:MULTISPECIES: prolipoprotein diacylglyceryl transferase [Advenella]MBV4398294.1 prolipoprotein diacylglyceryl transferase [Advenella alkanexedens]MDD3759096.1 prolipoprotein diacylglyceryl transferase [Advenella sp.]WKU20329.1 prolipoprotein diacylglyceryl transferase [Advenella alkanexedens]
MIPFPEINPVAIEIGPLKVHWYGLMYLLAFALVWILGRYRIKKGMIDLTQQRFEDLIFYGVLGVILGGRLGYILFYQPSFYLAHPLEIFSIWDGGMSFHGGLLGVLLAMYLFGRKVGKTFFEVTDFIAPLVPLGLACGRLGNFINGELWGRPADVPWAMIFPGAGNIPRHPSQIYQMLLEGILLFIILWLFSGKKRPVGQVSAVFLMGYGVFRFIAEYTREPDSYLGFLALGFSMGQWLSIPMILAGIYLYISSTKKTANNK